MSEEIRLNVLHPDCHKAADAFWKYWNENGETHKHGYYESTWGAINAALKVVGVNIKEDKPTDIDRLVELAAILGMSITGGDHTVVDPNEGWRALPDHLCEAIDKRTEELEAEHGGIDDGD